MAQSTTTIESVWAAKGNQPDNAIVATADGKYPALDGSLITNVGDLLATNNLSELTATASVARTNLELGETDIVEFGGFVPPAGTTAEIDAVTTAIVGSVMWDTDKNHYVRFDTPSTYTTLVGGEKLYLNAPDIGAVDYATFPQSWITGGIIANQPLATTTPITIKQKGWHRVTMRGTLNGLSAPTTSGNITVSVSGSSKIEAFNARVTQFSPTPFVTGMVSGNLPTLSSYVFDFTSTSFDMLSTASAVAFELSVDIYNDDGTEDVVTYTYDSPILYTVIADVETIETKLIS